LFAKDGENTKAALVSVARRARYNIVDSLTTRRPSVNSYCSSSRSSSRGRSDDMTSPRDIGSVRQWRSERRGQEDRGSINIAQNSSVLSKLSKTRFCL